MLIQLTIQNFLSFRDEVTFSMVGVSTDQQHADHLALDAAGKGRSVLPISAIYGANAAGKSNIIEAVAFVKELIVKGTRSTKSIPVAPFKLDNYSKEPSKFEFIFTYEGAQYSYGFKLNREQILEEWLYVVPREKKQEVTYFERNTSSAKETLVEFGPALKGRSEKRKQFLDFVAAGTRPNQLFLTEAVDRNVEALVPVVKWFEKTLTIIPAEADYRGLEIGVFSDKSFTEFLSDFLRFAGTGIDSISTHQVELDFDYHFPDMSEDERDRILEKLNESYEDGEPVAMLESSAGKRYLLAKDEQGQPSLIQLKTQHRHEDGRLIDFMMGEESEGTQRLINLIPALLVPSRE